MTLEDKGHFVFEGKWVPLLKRLEHLFVVRIWEEAGRSKHMHWRGSVQHVSSGKRLHFSSFADLNDFIDWRLHGGQSHREESPLKD